MKTKYRMLKKNEKIRVGDQLYDKWTRGWSTVRKGWGSVGTPVSNWVMRFRRKVN